MPVKYRKYLNQRGDTIIEVMVVLAVLGMAIGISYATANRSLLNVRQAQENSIATKLAQSQVEALSSLAANNTDPTIDIFNQTGTFCLYVASLAPNPTQFKLQKPAPATSGTDNCLIDNLYAVKVQYSNTANAPNTFVVTVTWDDVRGEGTNTVTMIYRVHRYTS
jgi:prepilin-type N-terminal cleavage/methylation domain-containing protein